MSKPAIGAKRNRKMVQKVRPVLTFRRVKSVIRIVNARQHNLQGITVELPRRTVTVVTGPSGTGKSSLAFDTLYAEGQRRYIESLSTYAKQFLERMPKPLVDRLEGIAPAVAIEQQPPAMSSRSTVGTATEIYDYLRLLWARIGEPFCSKCGGPVRRDTPQIVGRCDPRRRRRARADRVSASGRRPASRMPAPSTTSARWASCACWSTVSAVHLDELPADGRSRRRRRSAGDRGPAHGRRRPDRSPRGGDRDRVRRRRRHRARAARRRPAAVHRVSGVQRLRYAGASITPALFSFNNPRGACPVCNGFGAMLEYDCR